MRTLYVGNGAESVGLGAVYAGEARGRVRTDGRNIIYGRARARAHGCSVCALFRGKSLRAVRLAVISPARRTIVILYAIIRARGREAPFLREETLGAR